MRARPVVGITTSRNKSTLAWACDWLSVWRAGGRPLRIMPGRDIPVERLDALIIGGGDDIGADLYDGEIRLDVRIDPERDLLEKRLLDTALVRGLPVLGICRGAQMINVHQGGTLHSDIYEAFDGARRMRTVLPRKRITIDTASRLFAILDRATCRVNSLHHQSVNVLGEGLSIAAHDDDGIVQAIEDSARPFLLGVQWHPEFLIFNRPQQRLFRALVRAAQSR